MNENENKLLVIKFRLDMEQYDSNYAYFAGQLKQVIEKLTNGKAYDWSWEIRK